MHTSYKTIFTLFAAIALAACGSKENPLQKKKAELEAVKKQIAELSKKAKSLEQEIDKLGGSKKDNAKQIEIETVATAEFKSYLEVQGTADADQSTIATAKVPGTVVSVLVREGQNVSAGQTLAILDNYVIKQNRGPLEQQLELATSLFDKQKRLWEQGVGTEVQYLSAKTQKEALQKQLDALDAQISMYAVTAPISGTIESVDTKIGQAAAPGVPMFKVVNLAGIKVVANVAESYSGKVNQGDQVEVEFPDVEEKFTGTISFAQRIIDPLNRTFKIEVRMPNAGKVKPNMVAKLKIVDYKNKAAITIPTNAIQRAEDGDFVILAVEENGKTIAKRRMIKIAKNSGGRTEILSGLELSDRVIVNGFQEINEGQEVAISSNN